MSNFKDQKFWIGWDEELSKLVQDILFAQGYRWMHHGQKPSNLSALYLTTNHNGSLLFGEYRSIFLSNPEREIDVSWMSPRETIDIDGTVYYRDDYDEAIANLTEVKS